MSATAQTTVSSSHRSRPADERARCAICATEQSRNVSDDGLCVICGATLPPATRVAAAPRERGRSALAWAYDCDPGREGALGESFDEEPVRPIADLEAIHAVEKRADSLLALVPVVGLWRLWRSDLQLPGERRRLAATSLAITFALIVGVSAAWPRGTEDGERAPAETIARVHELAALLRNYASEFGRYPTEAEFAHSAGRGDIRFFDGWRRRVFYVSEAGGVRIGSYGADGRPGGEGGDADLFVELRRAGDSLAAKQGRK
jgi:hypothetical protein